MEGEQGTPAWMVCVDILNKAKRELVTQAIETLEAEIGAKRIDIRGSLINLPEQPNDQDTKLYVIGQIVGNAKSMRERYGEYIRNIHEKGGGATAEEVEGAERAGFLLMAVEKIEMLMGYSRRLDGWINAASMMVGEDDPSRVIAATMGEDGRREVLDFIRRNRVIMREGTFTATERQVIQRSLV